MTTSEQMFLSVAEEMNFTKAAEKNYVSQQAVSGHIRRLEEELGVKLFVRSPKLRLTDAGRIYYESLQKIRRIEQHTREAITYESDKIRAKLSLGVHADRAHLIFPRIFPRFHKMYPNVTISLVNGHTYDFVEWLRQGKIDLMIGHDMEPFEDLERETIFEEAIYLLASQQFLEDNLEEWDEDRVRIEPAEIAQLPMTCTSFGCAVMDHVKRFLKLENIMPRYMCEVGDYGTQLDLCATGQTAFFCPESYLIRRDFRRAMGAEGKDRVRALPVHRMEDMIHVELIYRKEDFEPRYLMEFKMILLEEYRNRVGKG